MVCTPFFAFTIYSVKFFLACSILDPRLICKRFFNIFLIVFSLLLVIGPDGAANLIQEVHGHLAGGVAQVMEDSGGGKFDNTGKVLVLQIIRGVQAAAGEDAVLDTGRQKVFEAHFQIQAVQSLQQTAHCVISKVVQIIAVSIVHRMADLLHKHPADA